MTKNLEDGNRGRNPPPQGKIKKDSKGNPIFYTIEDKILKILEEKYNLTNDTRNDAVILEQRSIGALNILEDVMKDILKMKANKR